MAQWLERKFQTVYKKTLMKSNGKYPRNIRDIDSFRLMSF